VNARAVVIGAGANELVAAHVLARGGWNVLVLDRTAAHADGAPEAVGWVAPAIVRDLELERHGLKIQRPDPWVSAPVADGARLVLWNDVTRSAESIRRFSPNDAARWPAFCEQMSTLARALETLSMAPPPDLMGEGIAALAELGGLALRLRRMGRQGLEDLLRIVPMPIADLLDDWFECDALKGVLGAAGVLHLHQGARAGGTTLNFLQNHVGCAPGVFRPALSNVVRLLGALPGIELRRGVEAARIEVREGQVTGVSLAGGEKIPAALVLSGADPRRTLLGLLDPGWLDPEFARTLRGMRSRGVVAQVTLTLDHAAGFETLAIAPSLDYLERAHDDAKYGRVSQQPYIEARAEDRSVHAHVQFAPYALTGAGWDDVQRDALADLVVRTLDAHAPGLSTAVTARGVLAPPDLERQFGWPEGQMHHAEPALDQWLWMRPTPELARYRTPIGGLYLCGPGMHPGAWMPGASGYHAARNALQALRDRPTFPS
jgi:phytoene dehydrogenase-like protein